MSNGRGSMVTYFGVAAGVLQAQRDHVASLIGDAHWASVGGHREELIRTLLEARLPNRFCVSEGFVVLCDGTVSPQIDVLIWDQQNHGPLFQAGRFVIVPPEGVVGVVEIKSSLNGRRMRDAACAVVSAKRLVRSVRERPVFGGIFGYRSDASIDHVLDSVRNALGWVDLADVSAFAPDIVAAIEEPMAAIIGAIVAPCGEIPIYSNVVPVLQNAGAYANLAPEMLVAQLLHFADHYFVRGETTDEADVAEAPTHVRVVGELQAGFPLRSPSVMAIVPPDAAQAAAVAFLREQWEQSRSINSPSVEG